MATPEAVDTAQRELRYRMGIYVAVVQLLAIPPALALSVFGTVVVTLLDLVRKRRLPKVPKTILITGATMGIGEGLARKYADRGVTLALTGRNKALLEAVGKACEAKGATVKLGNVDVTDREGMEKFIASVDGAAPIDLVIANAGVSEETTGTSSDIVAATRKLFAVNVDGVFNTILPLIPKMKERGSGQIAIMSSLAGTCAIPSMTAARLPSSFWYSATKNAVRAYGEGLRGLLYRDGVFVSVIMPGFVTTPMTDAQIKDQSRSVMPLKWELQPAVDHMVYKLSRDEPLIQFPGVFHAALWAVGCVIPTYVRHELARMRLPPFVGGLQYFGKRRAKKAGAASAAAASSGSKQK